MERHCYYARQPPKIEIRDGVVFLKPAGSHCEIAFSPQVLSRFIARANRVLDEWHESHGKVIEFPARH